MNKAILIFVLLYLLTPISLLADKEGNDIQLNKEKELVEFLKDLVTCKNMLAYEEGDLYCKLNFRGLQLEFAGVNSKGGGSIYIHSIGSNQTVGMRGSRCMSVMFGDTDLRGIFAAEILFRDDGVITHNYKNEEARAECQ